MNNECDVCEAVDGTSNCNCGLCDCGGTLYSVDIHGIDCECGQVYCIDCEAEYNKQGEKISYGFIY